MKTKTLIAISSFVVYGCNTHPVHVNTGKENIIKAWQEWPQKTASGQADYYWADDAIVMSQGQPLFEGKNNINEMMKSVFKIPGFKMSWDSAPGKIYISPAGDMAYLIASNQMSITDSTGKITVTNNTAFQVWKKIQFITGKRLRR